MIASLLLKTIVLVASTAPTAPDRPELPAPTAPSGDAAGASCPDRESVAAELAPALAHKLPGADPLPSDFRLVDLGAAFEVTVAGQTRRYADPSRDCAERARDAAVFVALMLNPPTLQLLPAEPAPPAVSTVAPPPPPETVSSRWAAVALALRYDDAAGGGNAALGGGAVGGELRGAIGYRGLGLVAAAGALSPTDGKIGAVSVRQQRFPCSLAVLVRRRIAKDVELRGAGGVSLTPVTLRGPTLATSVPATRLDSGALLAAELWTIAWSGRVAPFLSLHAEYFPRAYSIDVAPLGSIGSTAPFQLGLSVGVALGSRLPQ
jgi:hypothetical protein